MIIHCSCAESLGGQGFGSERRRGAVKGGERGIRCDRRRGEVNGGGDGYGWGGGGR